MAFKFMLEYDNKKEAYFYNEEDYGILRGEYP